MSQLLSCKEEKDFSAYARLVSISPVLVESTVFLTAWLALDRFPLASVDLCSFFPLDAWMRHCRSYLPSLPDSYNFPFDVLSAVGALVLF